MGKLVGACLVLLFASAFADVYMHRPRGSNNRLNEQSANRNNGNRLFDSQNNNRGGVNVGDKTNAPFNANNPASEPDATFNFNDKTTAMQYQEVYFEGSVLTVEWTAQHGCGGNDKDDSHTQNCDMVVQYTCDTDPANAVDPVVRQTVADPALTVVLRDGGNTNTPDEPNSYTDVPAGNAGRGHHESEAWYYECKTRQRNHGLFHADQRLARDTARYTRQNNNGNRNGLECPEERDYYPYWTPSPWRDIAYLTDTVDRCPYIQANSMNNNMKYKCTAATGTPTDQQLKPITKEACEAVPGAVWRQYTYDLPAPACEQAGWSRDNHLGNSRDGQPLTFNWTLPSFDDLVRSGVKKFGTQGNYLKCAFRLRYNISTDDYNPWAINSTWDDNPTAGIVSPITNNPTVDVGADLQGLRLAINTAQFGRTFQDRSHVFYIKKRPAAFNNKNIFNLNVRGKRGNIVQTYPSVEYDFVPNRLHVKVGDLVHLQWTGSNTHNNGNPGGDGQTGDAGQGQTGTDRNNFVQLLRLDDNYPMPYDKFQEKEKNMFVGSTCYNHDGTLISDWVDCALIAATSGYFRSKTAVDDTLNVQMNNAPASLVGGVVMSMNTAGTYHYMSSRNNNLTNRSQKGTLIVS